MKTKIEIGDYVSSQYGDRGSVIEEYENYWATPEPLSMSRQEWLDRQLIPYTEYELDERWFSIHCETGGSIRSCESRLTFLFRPEININSK